LWNREYQSGADADTNTQYPHIDLDHPEKYIGQDVTLVRDVDKIHSATAFVMEAKYQVGSYWPYATTLWDYITQGDALR